MPSFDLGPKPRTITGGCLCEAVRYKIIFPEDHDFSAGGSICQCTQCRKQTGSLFLTAHSVPQSAVEWTAGKDTALKEFAATPVAQRGFCGQCGSFLFWRPADPGAGRAPRISITIGSVDALYLFGEGEGVGEGAADVPAEGFGRALCSGTGVVEFCANEIKGVTDELSLLHRGKRSQGESSDE